MLTFSLRLRHPAEKKNKQCLGAGGLPFLHIYSWHPYHHFCLWFEHFIRNRRAKSQFTIKLASRQVQRQWFICAQIELQVHLKWTQKFKRLLKVRSQHLFILLHPHKPQMRLANKTMRLSWCQNLIETSNNIVIVEEAIWQSACLEITLL